MQSTRNKWRFRSWPFTKTRYPRIMLFLYLFLVHRLLLLLGSSYYYSSFSSYSACFFQQDYSSYVIAIRDVLNAYSLVAKSHVPGIAKDADVTTSIACARGYCGAGVAAAAPAASNSVGQVCRRRMSKPKTVVTQKAAPKMMLPLSTPPSAWKRPN